MVEIYDPSDYAAACGQRKKLLNVFYILLGALIAVNVAVFVFYTFQEYKTSLYGALISINIGSCAIFAIIYYIVFAIKYKRANCYRKMLYYFDHGLRQDGTNAFVRVDNGVVRKDGVDFVGLIFLEWSDKKQEYFERQILFDVEKQLPDFKKGDVVHHITQSNILIAYELSSPDIFE